MGVFTRTRKHTTEWHAENHAKLTDLTRQISTELGVRVTVEASAYWIGSEQQFGFYNVRTPFSSSGPHTFGDAWMYLQGYRSGAEDARR